jgi:hypothetical protein
VREEHLQVGLAAEGGEQQPRSNPHALQIVTVRARSLLGAADSRRHRSEPEDRLTEILREVLMTAPALASWLVEKAFRVSESEARRCCSYGDYEVDTQFALRSGERPDMRFRFLGEHRPPGELFCENKIHAGFTAWQVAGYPSVPESGRIVVLSPSGDRRPNESPKFVPLSWTDLAREADRVGRQWGGLNWPTEAVRPDAPGQHRMLAELVSYLKREDVDVSIARPITDSDLSLLPDVSGVVVRWKQFRDLVLAELRRRQRDPVEVEKKWEPESPSRESLAVSVTLREGAGWKGADWPAMSRVLAPPKWSWQELILSPEALWMNLDKPFVAIGVGLRSPPDWSEGMNEWSRLQEAIKGTGAWLGFTNREKIYRVLVARPLAEIMAPAETLDAQAEDAVTWALTALDRLLALEAGT